MLTNFGRARMARYTQAFFRITTHGGIGGSIRWMARELVTQDAQSESDDDSLIEEDLSQYDSAFEFARPADQRNINPATLCIRNQAKPIVNVNHGSSLPEVKEDEEDIDSDEHHTKETDMWAFGMVIYVCGSIVC